MLNSWIKEFIEKYSSDYIHNIFEVLMNICSCHTATNNNDEIFVDKGSFGTCYSLTAVIKNYQYIEAQERILAKYSSLQQKWIIRKFNKLINNNYNDYCAFLPDDKIYPEIIEDVFTYNNN